MMSSDGTQCAMIDGNLICNGRYVIDFSIVVLFADPATTVLAAAHCTILSFISSNPFFFSLSALTHQRISNHFIIPFLSGLFLIRGSPMSLYMFSLAWRDYRTTTADIKHNPGKDQVRSCMTSHLSVSADIYDASLLCPFVHDMTP